MQLKELLTILFHVTWSLLFTFVFIQSYLMKYLFSIIGVFVYIGGGSALFANNSFQIVPEADNTQKADEISRGLINIKPEEDFWDKYNSGAESLDKDLWGQIRSGVFSWNSVLAIGAYILRFIMQISLVIGAFMVIKSWYEYAMTAWWVKDGDKHFHSAIKNALIGLLVISLSYTIIKLLQMAFLS